MRPTPTLLAAAAAALLLASGCAHPSDPTPRADLSPLPHGPIISRIAPDFTFRGASVHTLRGLRGQAVVLVIADSPRTGAFKKQLRNLEEAYADFASRQAVFIAAFRNQDAEAAVHSNIPFAIATNGAAVASAYGVNDDMNIVIIGKDQNVDYQTGRKVPGDRVRDVIQNSYAVQTPGRKAP